MPVNMYYNALTNYEIRHFRGNPTGWWPPIKIQELVPHPETDEVAMTMLKGLTRYYRSMNLGN